MKLVLCLTLVSVVYLDNREPPATLVEDKKGHSPKFILTFNPCVAPRRKKLLVPSFLQSFNCYVSCSIYISIYN